MTDPLDTNKLLRELPTRLPRSTSSPLARPTDVVAALVHTIHAALDFRLVNQPPGEAAEQRQVEGDFDDNASDTATAVENEEEGAPAEGALSAGWNSRGEDAYMFEYKHDQSSLTFRVRVGRMGGRVQIDATAEDAAPSSLSVVLGDLVDTGVFPIPGTATAEVGAAEAGATEADVAKAVGFWSVDVAADFVNKYKRDILAKLLPGLQKEGYNEASGSDSRGPPPAQSNPQPARPRRDPLIDPEHAGSFGRHPASIGYDDLNPQGIHPGRLGPIGPGGGMHMDFNHPLFDGRRRGDPDMQGPGGSIQPPGARWDPVGPGAGGFPGVGGMGVGDGGRDRWGDELPPPGEFGPDLGGLGGPRGGGGGGGFGGLGGGGRRGFGGGGFGGGGMFM